MAVLDPLLGSGCDRNGMALPQIFDLDEVEHFEKPKKTYYCGLLKTINKVRRKKNDENTPPRREQRRNQQQTTNSHANRGKRTPVQQPKEVPVTPKTPRRKAPVVVKKVESPKSVTDLSDEAEDTVVALHNNNKKTTTTKFVTPNKDNFMAFVDCDDYGQFVIIDE